MKRAKTYDEIKPLIEMCKLGKLFDVQGWVAAGNPVNPPKPPEKGRRPRSPLQYAIDSGFHSLVQVLLEAGAEIEDSCKYSDLNHALWEDQYEIVKLLIAHGADVKRLDMYDVFCTWQPDLMECFIERGADVETGNPLAHAFCRRIRTALKIYKRYKDRFPSFQEQANIALRHHCKEGNTKWVSLMLWAGADPYATGSDEPERRYDEEYDHNALELAALYGHFDVFRMKAIRLDPRHERARDLIRMACHGESAELLKRLLELGYPINDQANGGSSHVEGLLSEMGWWTPRNRKSVDTPKARERLKMLHMLVRYGGRWIPEDRSGMNRIRRSLLGVTADYTVEVIWIMAKYGGCARATIEALLKTPTLRAHVMDHYRRVDQLAARLPEKVP